MTSKKALKNLGGVQMYYEDGDYQCQLEEHPDFKQDIEIIKQDLEENKHLRKQLQKARNEKRRWKNKALQQKEILEAIKKVFYDKLDNWYLLDNMPSLRLDNEPKEYEIIRQWIKQWLEVDKNG